MKQWTADSGCRHGNTRRMPAKRTKPRQQKMHQETKKGEYLRVTQTETSFLNNNNIQ